MREKAKPTVQIDDDKVKVTRWDFLPGAETGGINNLNGMINLS